MTTEATITIDKSDFIMVNASPAMSGHFATLYSWDEECGFHTPWTTGFGRYETWQQAEVEARQWAKSEGVRHIPLTQEAVDRSARFAENFKRRAARIVELRRDGMELREAYQQAKLELPDPK